MIKIDYLSQIFKKIIPLFIAALIIIFLFKFTLSPNNLEISPLIGKKIPQFNIPTIENEINLTAQEIIGRRAIIFFFASWCEICHTQVPIFNEIKKYLNINIYAIGWNDDQNNLLDWQKKYNGPFDKIGIDNGNIGIDFGITGVPEIFLVNKEGIIIYKHIGRINKHFINKIMENAKR